MVDLVSGWTRNARSLENTCHTWAPERCVHDKALYKSTFTFTFTFTFTCDSGAAYKCYGTRHTEMIGCWTSYKPNLIFLSNVGPNFLRFLEWLFPVTLSWHIGEIIQTG